MRFPHPGEVFQKKYELTDQLGRGGFAAVYRARDMEIGREVAIKILMPDEGGYDSQHAARFLREARVVAQLNDPHTITMYDFGRTDDGLLFMVFEYVAGQDLAHRLAATGPLPPAVAVHVLRQLLEALREAHALGVLHRDLKPANILIYEYQDDPWRVKLLDFGIAKPGIGKGDDVHATLTQAGSVVGTPRYMSPEQLTGEQLQPASDIFSLGLLAYEMLVGEPAINGKDTRENLRLQLADTPLRFPANSAVPPPLIHLVEQMLIRKVADGRIRTTEQALAALANPSRLPGSGPLATTTDYGVASRRGPDSGPQMGHRDSSQVVGHRTTQRIVSQDGGPSWFSPWVLLLVGVLVGGIGIGAVLRLRDDPPTNVVVQPAKRVNPLLTVAAEQPAPEAVTAPDLVADPVHAKASPGCGRDADPGIREITDSFTGNTWNIYVPVGYDPNQPHGVVLMLHDRTRSGVRMIHDTEMIPIADEHQLLLVAPNGSSYMMPWPPESMPRLQDILNEAADQYCVDPQRRYGIGHNLGGAAIEELVCILPMSAIATTAFRGGNALLCPSGNKVPYIHLAGARNKYSPIAGGTTCDGGSVVPLSTKNDLWRERNACGDKGTTTKYDHGECVAYSCDAAYTVCELDGGRDWPKSGARDIELPGCKEPPPQFPISEVIWEFFEKNAFPIVLGEKP